jgi:hypothetical protein
MTTPGLAKWYDRLTDGERLPLLLAAQARGDAAEYRRLVQNSPVRAWRFAEHLWAEIALHVLALTSVGAQLDAAAGFFFDRWRSGNADDLRLSDRLLAADARAYSFAANAEAWRRFCAGLGVAPAALTAANHRGWFLRYCEEHLPAHAPTAEAARAQIPESSRDGRELVTADDLLARWRRLWQEMTGPAPRGSGEGDRRTPRPSPSTTTASAPRPRRAGRLEKAHWSRGGRLIAGIPAAFIPRTRSPAKPPLSVAASRPRRAPWEPFPPGAVYTDGCARAAPGGDQPPAEPAGAAAAR